MGLQLVGTVEEHSELSFPGEGEKPLSQSFPSVTIVLDQHLGQVRELDLSPFNSLVELYQRFFDHPDIFRIEVLARVVSRGHGHDKCREQRLLFAREFSSEGVDDQGMIQIHSEILSAEKLAYPLVAAALIDDENHRIEP